jgi:hypothetical protein
MKTLGRSMTILLVALLSSNLAHAHSHVRGYARHNGTYVMPHHRSSPDHSFSNNWSTKGNVNPFTGKTGTKVHKYNHFNYPGK